MLTAVATTALSLLLAQPAPAPAPTRSATAIAPTVRPTPTRSATAIAPPRARAPARPRRKIDTRAWMLRYLHRGGPSPTDATIGLGSRRAWKLQRQGEHLWRTGRTFVIFGSLGLFGAGMMGGLFVLGPIVGVSTVLSFGVPSLIMTYVGGSMLVRGKAILRRSQRLLLQPRYPRVAGAGAPPVVGVRWP